MNVPMGNFMSGSVAEAKDGNTLFWLNQWLMPF